MKLNTLLLILMIFFQCFRCVHAQPGHINDNHKDTMLSAGATLLFKGTECHLLNSQKNRIYNSLEMQLTKDKKQFVFEGAEDDPFDTELTVEDLNNDHKEEIFVIYGNTFSAGNAGRNVALFICDAKGNYQLHLGFGAVGYSILETKHLGFPDLTFAGPGMQQPVWRWSGKTYEYYKSIKIK